MNRKMLAIVLTLCMILSMMPTAAFAAGDDFHDIDGHWAEEVIEKWADRNIVSGMGNNQFNPNGEMTRAQAAAVFANFFGLSKKADVSHFTDVEDAWYTDAIAMCVEAGIMSGVGNNKMDPHGTLTREQMFTMFANGLGLKPEPTSEKEFADDHKTSGWAQGYVNALVNRGYVSGMGGNKLAPDQEINRASVMALIDSTVAEYVTESGSTVEAPKDGGMVIVVADDVTITGELSGTVLAVGGDTKITVEKATADAEVVVASGSENVTVSGEFAGTVTVAANDTTVTVENATEEAKVVVAAENTTIEGEIKGTVEVAEGATGTTVAAETAKVEVTGESATVAVTGKVETVEVKETAAGSSVEVAKDATVTTVKTEAAESTVNVAGTVKDVEVSEKAGNTTVTTESTAKVENVKTEAAGTTVAGEGKVEKVEATENATGTTVNTNGSAVENNSKEDVTVGTGTVGSGSTGTSAGETSKPTEGTTTPSTSSTPSSSSKPSHSHTWGAWKPNYDGTHTRTYSCGHSGSETADCTFVEGKCSVCGDETIYVASTEEAQEALDKATTGDVIRLISGVNYGTLYLGRPTKYNDTTMCCDTQTQDEAGTHIYTTTNADEFKAHLAETGYHTTPKYTTTVENLTIVGAENATIDGLVVTSGHTYVDTDEVETVYDYVLEKNYTVGSVYYLTLNLENILFQNVNFVGKIDINTSDATSVYDGITFEGCTFTTGGTDSENGAAIRYYNEANNGNVKNITVTGCAFTNCYQGVYVHHVNGVTVTNSDFETIGHNAIAMQGHAGAVALKTVVVDNNTFNNANDRVIRFNEVGADSDITITNNVATNSGNEDGELIKATTIAEDASIVVEDNTWNGYDDEELSYNNGVWNLPVVVSDAESLSAALAAGKNVILAGKIDAEAATTAPYGNKYGFKLDGSILDGKDNELCIECYGDDYGIMTSGGTVKNLTIQEGCRAIMIMYPTQDIILDNVKIGGDGVLYPINTGEAGSDGIKLTVSNSTLKGWTSYNFVESASFTNCEFGQGTYYNNIYGRVLKPYVNTTITGCSFVEHMNLDLSALIDGQKVTFKDCTVNGQDITADVFTIPNTDDDYDTMLFSVDLPSWAESITDCIIFAE